MMVRSRINMVLLLFFVCIAPCHAEKISEPSRTLYLTFSLPPNSFDGLRTELVQTSELMSLLLLPLKSSDGLDTSWELLDSYAMSEDGLSYILRLKNNIPWSDGVLASAADLQTAIRYQTGKNSSTLSRNLYPQVLMEKTDSHAEPVAKVEILDPLSVKVYLKSPDPFFIEKITSSFATLLRADLYKKYGQKWHLPENLVTLSPFKIRNNQLPKRIILEKIPDFPNADEIYWDRIDISFIGEPSDRINALKTGKTDYIEYRADISLGKKLGRLPGRWVPASFAHSRYLMLNPDKAVFADKRLRKAIKLLADPLTLTQWEDHVELPLNFIIPPGLHEPYRPANLKSSIPTLAQREDNFEKAAKLLHELGISPESPLKLEYRLEDVKSIKRSGLRLQRIARQYGLNIELLIEPAEVHYPKFFSGDYDLSLIVWWSLNSNPLQQLIPFSRNSHYVKQGYKNTEYLEMLGLIRQQHTRKGVYKFLRKAENILLEDGFVIPVSTVRGGFFVSDRIGELDFMAKQKWLLPPSESLLKQANSVVETAKKLTEH